MRGIPYTFSGVTLERVNLPALPATTALKISKLPFGHGVSL
jgi:hypothetical protein